MRRLLPCLAFSLLVLLPTAGSGALFVSPGPDIDFGRINLMQPKTIPLTITNAGGAPLTVTGYAISGLNPEAFTLMPASPGPPPYILNPTESAMVDVIFQPTSAGLKGAALTIMTDEPGSYAVQLTGTGVFGALSVTPSSIDFGNVLLSQVGSVPVTVTNTVDTPILILGTATSGPEFGCSSFNPPLPLAPGASTVLEVTFAPALLGTANGFWTLTSDDPNVPTIAVDLHGIGVAPAISVGPPSLDFGTIPVGGYSDQTVGITNTGTANLTVLGLSIGGPESASFTIVSPDPLPYTLLPGASAPVTVRFSPSSPGPKSATLAITSDASSGVAVPLAGAGAGVGVLDFNPKQIDFGTVTYAESPFAVFNAGDGPLTVTAMYVVGPDASSFAISVPLPLPHTLAPGDVINSTVTFSPTSADPKSATLVIESSDMLTPQALIPLSGTGLGAILVPIPATLDFAGVTVGELRDEPLTINNGGRGDLVVSDMSITGPDASFFELIGPPSVPFYVLPGQSLGVTIRFTPASIGAKIATLTLLCNDPRGQVDIPLHGVGIREAPHVAGVRDIPNDRGGKVKLFWDSSTLDTDPQPVVDHYWIFRSVPPPEAAVRQGIRTRAMRGPLAAPSSNALYETHTATGTIYWEWLTSVPAAHAFEGYSYVASTLSDSTAASNPYTWFLVMALNADNSSHWESAPDSGYSVDNLAPAPPAQFAGTYLATGTRDLASAGPESLAGSSAETPHVAGVRDIPKDQGGKVKLFWNASTLDTDPQPVVDHYWIFRSVPPQSPDAATGTTYWEWLTSVPATHVFEGYSYVASTLSDSTAASNPYTWFLVMALNVGNSSHWESAPDSGYSVDNLAPAPPTQFAGTYLATGTRLRWKPNAEADLGGYRVYRGDAEGFVPGPENFVGSSAETTLVDAGTIGAYYQLSAVDVHGNESGFTPLSPSQISTVGEGSPAAFVMAPPSPNPSSGETRLGYSLGAPASVRVTIYDPLGRRVRELSHGTMPAGEHRLRWDGRDDRGNPVASGVYFLRLQAGKRLAHARIVWMR